jgi:hypothetical protein
MSEDYEVGYGKPPKHTQFQKGASGNAKGRLKGTKNLSTDLVNMFIKLVPDEVDDKETSDLTQTDLAILERFKKVAIKSPVATETSDDH